MVLRYGNGRKSSKQQILWSKMVKCLSSKREFVGPFDQLTGDATIPCSLELDRPGHFAVCESETNVSVHKTFRLFDERTGSLGGDLGENDKRPMSRSQGCVFNACLSLDITFCEENAT